MCQFDLFREECTHNTYQSYLVVGIFLQELLDHVMLAQSAPVVELLKMFFILDFPNNSTDVEIFTSITY